MKKRKLLYLAIELLYTLIAGCYLFYVKHTYSFANSFETVIFWMLLLILFAGIVLFGAFWNKLFVLLFLTTITLYLVGQNVYYRAFQQYFRLATIFSLRDEGLKFIDSARAFLRLEDSFPFLFLLALTLVFIGFYFLLQRKTFHSKKRFLVYLCGVGFLLPIIPLYSSYQKSIEATRQQQDAFQLNKTDYYIYNTVPTTKQFVEKFSLLPLALRDLSSVFEKDILTSADYERVHKFLQERKDHQNNEMTGIFKDKNLLVILAESMNDFIIDEELTPTLYKMKTQGINIDGFNTSTMTGSTSASEFMANTSIIPLADGDAACYAYPFNSYQQTLPSIFKQHGYVTRATHNNYGQYYNRNVLFPAWGYDHFFDCTGLGLDNLSSDSQVMESLKWTLSYGENKYMDFWISYSGHQPYNFTETGVRKENVERIQQKFPHLSEPYAAYLAKNMDFDQALQSLLEALASSGKLDDYVIVVFGDHHVKELDYGSTSPFFSQTGKKAYEKSGDTDLFIYNSATEALNFPKTATLLDLLPTLENMWGFTVDYHSILGSDIFDPNYKGYHFGEWDYWSTDDYVCDVGGANCHAKPGKSAANAETEMAYYQEMFDVSRLILKLDYFAEKK